MVITGTTTDTTIGLTGSVGGATTMVTAIMRNIIMTADMGILGHTLVTLVAIGATATAL